MGTGYSYASGAAKIEQRNCFHQRFEDQAARTPEAAAVEFRGCSWTYSELNARANALAHYLQSRGVGPEALVGISCARSLDLMVAVLGILKAGGAYVPLDPSLPPERLAFLLDDAEVEIVLTQSAVAGRLPGKTPRLCLDTEWHLVETCPTHNPIASADPDDLAYVLYTSGSTGKPKGVEIPHRGLSYYLSWAVEAYSCHEGSGAPVQSSIGFDATITSWFTPLVAGKTVIMLPEERELEELAAVLTSGRDLTLVKLTPSHLEALQHLLPRSARLSVRAFVIGGEALFHRQLASWQSRAPHVRLINEYGPTETVVGCCVFEAGSNAGGDGPVPIGRPIAGASLYVLDERMQPVLPGVPGELYIGGPGVARGYHNRPELTAEKFLPNPFGPGRLYRTGDLVQSLSDGDLVFLGRLDEQVKIRGYRIEPAEIEAALASHPAVASCAVVVRDGPAREKHLVAYIVPRSEPLPPTTGWADFLRDKLPPYMFPSAYMQLDNLPLTPNGKLDRRALPPPDFTRPARRGRNPRTSLELQLLRIWESVLGVHPVALDDDFFLLGGHSLMALRLIYRIERATGTSLPLSAIFQAPTVEKMASLIANQGVDPNPGAIVAIQPEGARPPLFCVHGIGGTILNYGHVARYLPDDQPLYGLQARGIDGKQPPYTRIEDMAAEYVAQIRTVQPAGPYYLSGYSFGGLVAFEIASQLEAAGERVALLLLLDSNPHGVLRTLPRAAYFRGLLRRQAGRILLHGRELLRLSLPEKRRYVTGGLRTIKRKLGNRWWQVRYKAYEKFGQPVPQAFLNVKEAGYLALRQYLPGRCSCPAVLFLAANRPTVEDPAMGWSRLIGGGVAVRVVPGGHNTITVGENAAVLGREITAALEHAQNAEARAAAAAMSWNRGMVEA